MKIDQVYCIREYWCDFPRFDRMVIDKIECLTKEDKKKVRTGTGVGKTPDGGTYINYYNPIVYDDIID